MGQPVKLYKDDEVMTVYGPAQKAIYLADGWSEIAKIPYAKSSEAREAVAINKATNKALGLALEHGVDLVSVEGTGANGRITVSDVRAVIDGD